MGLEEAIQLEGLLGLLVLDAELQLEEGLLTAMGSGDELMEIHVLEEVLLP